MITSPSLALWISLMQDSLLNKETFDIFYEKCKVIVSHNSFVFTSKFLKKNPEMGTIDITKNAFDYIKMKPNKEPSVENWQLCFGQKWYNYGINKEHLFLYQKKLIIKIGELKQEHTKRRIEYTKYYIYLQKFDKNVNENDNRMVPFQKSIESVQNKIISLVEELIKIVQITYQTIDDLKRYLKRLNNENFSFTRDMCKTIESRLNIKCFNV